MHRFQQSIQRALQNEAWYSALALALCIPDICNGFEGKRGGEAYAEWFEAYMPDKYHNSSPEKLSGKNCYALRCAYAHDGNQRIDEQRARDKVLDEFLFVADRDSQHRHQNHLMRSNRTLQVEIHCFCNDMSNAIVKWWRTVVEPNPEIKEEFESTLQIFEM